MGRTVFTERVYLGWVGYTVAGSIVSEFQLKDLAYGS